MSAEAKPEQKGMNLPVVDREILEACRAHGIDPHEAYARLHASDEQFALNIRTSLGEAFPELEDRLKAAAIVFGALDALSAQADLQDASTITPEQIISPHRS